MAGYASVFGVALASRLLLALLPVAFVSGAQRTLVSWPLFALFAICFGAAVALAFRAGLPTPAESVSNPGLTLGLPIAVGTLAGLLLILSDVAAPVAIERSVSTLHVHGWAAVPFYAYAAILLTTVFHFLPMAAVAWLAQRLPAALRLAFVALAITAIALSEDTRYFLQSGPQLDIEGARHLLSVVANGTEALFIYRFGLLSGLAQRSATYFLWHLLWPAFGHS